MLKYFKRDTNRDTLYPDLACYQMNIAQMAQLAIDDGVDEELLPSWSKFGNDPLKSKGFFTYMLQGMFEGKHNGLEIDVEYQTNEIPERRVAMMFISSANNENLMKSGKIADSALSSFEVLVLCGHKDNRIGGQKVTNRNAQQLVSEVIESSDKDILILSNQMASRSFSIPEITELYLAYDNGDNGATNQKMSRTLTPNGSSDKVGRIFSLSFDPNRDDKFDTMVIEAALKVKKPKEDIVSAMRRVLMSMDIFRCTEEGAQLFNEGSFIKDALERNGLSRVMGKIADVSNIPDEVAHELASGNINVKRLEKIMKSVKGKTFADKKLRLKGTSKKSNDDQIKKVREMITTIIENVDILIEGTGNTNVANAMGYVIDNKMESEVTHLFGIDFDVLKFVFDHDIIKQDWVDIRMQA
jgi:hypothetical protein